MISKMLHFLQLVFLAVILLGCAHGSDDIRTLPAISGLRGSTVDLPCEVDGPVIAVIWYRHNSTGDPAATIVIQQFENRVINNVGPRFIMTSTYSLVVRNLVVEDETTYSCHAALENGDSPRLYINLTVIVLADPLHPTVDHCEPTSEGECTYTVGKLMEEFEMFPIVCRVNMVRPPVNLSWTSMKGDTHSEEYARRAIYVEGGFWNVSLALKVSRHEIGRKFRCLAEGVGVKGSADMIALVKRYETGTEQPGGTSAAPSDKSSMGWFIAITVASVVAIVILIVGFVWMHRKSKARSRQPYNEISQPQSTELQARSRQPYYEISQPPSTELQEIRKKISTYKPGAYARVVQESLPAKTLLAMYGVGGAGRSSLAKSFIYSVTDEYRRIETGSSKDGRGVTKETNFYMISDNIAIQDTVGLPKRKDEVSGVVSKMLADKICCPIIVIGRNQDIEPYEPMFREFITDIIERLSLSPVFIVTRKNDDIGNPHDDKMIKLITELGGASDRTFFVDNILEETSDEDSKKTFLEILFKLLQIADDNIVRKANKIFQDGLTASST